MTNHEYVGIAVFMLMIAIGFAFVSVHYRKKYEYIKKLIETEIYKENKASNKTEFMLE